MQSYRQQIYYAVFVALGCTITGCQLSHHGDELMPRTIVSSAKELVESASQHEKPQVASPAMPALNATQQVAQVAFEQPLERQDAFTEDELISLALQRNPGVQAARYDCQAAEWSASAAGMLEDPRLAITTAAAPIETANGPQDVALSLNQKLPAISKRRKQWAIASAAATEARARVAQTEQLVIADVRRGFAELVYRQEALAVIEADQRLMSDVTRLTLEKYRTNQVNQQDVAQAELEELSLVEERVTARQALSNAQTELGRLLQIASGTPLVAIVEEAGLGAIPTDVQSLCCHALSMQPQLQALSARATQEQLKSHLERLASIPDPTVGATWVAIGGDGTSPTANGQDAVLVNFSMNLPVNRRRIAANVRSATARACGAVQRLDDQQAATLRDVYNSYTELQSERELIELLQKDVIPKVKESMEATIDAYRVSRATYVQVVEVRRLWLQKQLDLAQRHRDHRITLASLRQYAGMPEICSASTE